MSTHPTRRNFLERAVSGLGGITAAAHYARASSPAPPANIVAARQSSAVTERIAFAIHGGAGTIERSSMKPELERAYRAALTEALLAGRNILQKRGTSLDAVTAAIVIMEDSPLFNAGKGAVFTNAGTNELDASIMDGQTLKAGAVASLKHIKNPITLARLVMERSPHVLMAGEGAERFAREQGGIEFVDQKYFYTEERWKALQKIQADEKRRGAAGPDDGGRALERDRHGTVGAIARDFEGNLAAGTSTGGMTNKRFGRIGDSPIIGAGTYANNNTCAVSATGDGEYFIRTVVAHHISALIEYKNLTVEEAAKIVIDKVGQLGGTGGVIAMGRGGELAMPFNSDGMYRGYLDAGGQPVTRIYQNE